MLPATTTFFPGSVGNLIAAATTLALSGVSSTPFVVGVNGNSGAQGSITTGSAVGGRLQVKCVYGTVAATAGLRIQVLSSSDTGPTVLDTIGIGGCDVTQTAVTSTTVTQSFDLSPGQYSLKLTNLDATNAVTVTATLGTTA